MGAAYPERRRRTMILETYMVEEKGRLGRKTKAGFYDYDDTGQTPAVFGRSLRAIASRWAAEQPTLEDGAKPADHGRASAWRRCARWKTGVLVDIREGDVGAILGWGFAPWSGGRCHGWTSSARPKPWQSATT